MAANDAWNDFEVLRHNVKHNTVDRLKQILGGFNDECGTHFSKSGKKQDIIDRIVHTIDSWKHANSVDKWLKAKQIFYQVRNSGTSVTNAYASSSSIGKLPGYTPPSAVLSTSSFINSYSSRELVPPLGSSGSSSSLKPPINSKPELRFKASPFFRVHETIAEVVECPESQSVGDRKQATLTFNLSQDQITKLKAVNSNYHLRLFCTSSTFYSPNSNFRTFPSHCPIEFPSTCEVRVNTVQITASLKGLKKKPGTAPPPELDKYVEFVTSTNRVDMIYVNSQQPPQPKKYYLTLKLVESTSVVNLVDNLKRNHFESSEKIKNKMQANSLEDDDIVAGPQKMSLKCPLTLARIATPCRSSKCVHVQCFDATSWFSVNEQTTTWLCPVCEKTLEVSDLIIDGFSESILKDCPDSVDDVMVEADGEWHTSDNKYGSPSWKLMHPPKTSNASMRKPASAARTPLPNGNPSSSSTGPNGVRKPNIEITVLDSDDEDEGRVKRELSPSSFGNLSSASQSQSSVPQTLAGDVIDLTIDSDDDEPPPPRNAGKRKASDAVSPTESIWKKAKTADFTPADSSSLRVNGEDTSRSIPGINAARAVGSAPAPGNLRLTSTYNSSSPSTPTSLPSFHAGFTRPPNGVAQLPPINGYSSSRGSGASSNSRWG
ncbi:hypothetical protein BT96DRAFT_954104 [Gymnopus androsaceus JB14]|uniref:Zf-MIZ-domain-containing protein n=1 Tax=Gymnopus androsaceus JB14 TaxID=1447944 RepID=A0A6A4IHT7_9AGAR|nr:hypothetical protein BT96DRAFT_954104 [Gymnopus androsaceus JB14]